MEQETKASILIRLMLLVSVVWLVGAKVVYVWVTGESRDTWDVAFEAMNTFFSALAFGGIIWTIYQQQQSINHQQRASDFQRFETTFFQMLQTQGDIIRQMDLRGPDKDVTVAGRDCFKDFYNKKFEAKINKLKRGESTTTLPNGEKRTTFLNKTALTIEEKLVAYELFFDEWQSDVGHYFRHLYHIVRHVDEAELTEADKKKFIRLVRAQLSSYELLMIFYNCLSQYGVDKFKPLIEKYALFKNMPWALLKDPSDYHLYESGAYGNSFDSSVANLTGHNS